MNTGIQDAFDLGWKFAAVLDGWGGPALLESLRRRAAPGSSARAADVSLKNYRRLVSAAQRAEIHLPTPEGETARRAIGAQLVEENEKAWHPVGVHLGYIYHPSPFVVPDGTPPPEDDTFGYRPTAFPGARAPHVWLGPERSILDLFGDGFVLLKFGDVATDGIEGAAKARGVPFRVHRIDTVEAAAPVCAAAGAGCDPMAMSPARRRPSTRRTVCLDRPGARRADYFFIRSLTGSLTFSTLSISTLARPLPTLATLLM